MTDTEILKQAIAKAKKGGFKLQSHKHFTEIGKDTFGQIVGLGAYESIIFDHEFAKIGKDTFGQIVGLGAYESIIFDHEFAKAFWGKENMEIDYDTTEIGNWKAIGDGEDAWLTYKGKVWQYHLQQMVLEEEPLKYLEKFL